MRIFKNRGDIFFSKTNKKKSTEQKFLLISLVLIIIFTIIFVIITGVKNDFSAKNFFKPDNLEITQNVIENDQELPQLSGKNNFLIMINDDENLLFSYLLQVDKDTTSYKLTTLRSDAISQGKSLADIFLSSGEKNTYLAVSAMLDIEIDYYISFDRQKFIDIFDEMGTVKYPLIEEIKYKSKNNVSPFSLRLKDGEQSIKGAKAVDLVRYFLENDKDSMANDFLLACLVQQINSTNYEKSEQLFQHFIKNSSTNITVKEFSASDDVLMVFSSERAGVKVYNAPASYSGNKITQDSLKKIKGYFVK